MRGSYLPTRAVSQPPKAVEDYRSPRRFASHKVPGSQSGLGGRQSSGALWADLKWPTAEKRTLTLRTESGRGLPQSKTLRESQAAGKSVRSWSAPVLWRFAGAPEWPTAEKRTLSLRTESGRGLPQSKTLRESQGAGKSARSWSAPVLWRFAGGPEMGNGRKTYP